MFRTRPSSFALACVALWGAQLVLSLMVSHYCWLGSSTMQRWLDVTMIATEVVLGGLILLQLPRALQWQPRRNPRPSAELQAERQRIARELHDNLGSQLVSAMAMLHPLAPAPAQALQALELCLLDLRLVVDSMNARTDTLEDRLARLRHRVQPALDQRGIRMEWDVQCLGSVPALDAERSLHMASIVQEALSNVLQHARATRVAVRVGHDAHLHSWFLEVCDNGRGLPDSVAVSSAGPAGMGLPGMRSRAQEIGGALELTRPEGGGTCVRVVVPDGATATDASAAPSAAASARTLPP